LSKFKSDRFFYENENFILSFEGINYNSFSSPEDFLERFLKTGVDFISKIEGVFSGFIFSKQTETIQVFNDSLGTKNIFYFYDSKLGFAFSSEMHVLSKVLRENNIGLNYNTDAIYSLALYGQVFDDQTVVNEINRLEYGTIMSFDLKTKALNKQIYYFIDKPINNTINLQDAISEIDRLMLKSVEREWQKDLTENKKHLTLISGGMDSRVNALLACELGFDKINSYTYGAPNSSDVRISNIIAKDNFYAHSQLNLNNGLYLSDFIMENYIIPSDGLSIYTPIATMQNALKRMNFSDYGVLHSGQVGDVVFGSFVRENFDIQKNKDKIGLTGNIKHKNLIEKIESLNNILDRYQDKNYELYSYEQRQINGTLTGDRVASNYIDHISPFYNRELIDFMFSLPAKFKVDQNIYFKWLEERHPKILKYEWEKIGFKPNKPLKRRYGGLIKKYVNGGKKYFNLPYDSMNPISNWVSQEKSMLENLNSIFESHISLLSDKELQKDLTLIYQDDIFEYRNKFSTITVLLSLKLHFGL
jgi:asparagine synthase (glutamine-hydrolysing)